MQVKGKDNFDQMPTVGGSLPIVPSGGTSGQALLKNSGTDYDYGWADISLTDYVLKAGDSMTGALTITTTGGGAQLILDNATATTGWEITAGRVGYFDQWLLFTNEGEAEAFSFCVTNSGQFRGKKGSAGAPTYSFYSFGGDPDSSNYGMSWQASPKALNLSSEGIPRLQIESDGTLNTGNTANYENLVTDDDDIPNKKYVDDNAGSAVPQQVTATAGTTTTSGTDTLVNSMTITPADGNYMVWFSSSMMTTSSSATVYVSLYVNGVKVAHTERQAFMESSIPSTYMPVAFQAYVTGVTGSIEVRWRRSAGTANMSQRTLTIQKIG